MRVVVIPADLKQPIVQQTIPDGNERGSLEALQKLVAGQIETCQVGPKAEAKGPLAVFFNDEGKVQEPPLPTNVRATVFLSDAGLQPDDYIAGNFVITGFDPDSGDSIDSPLSVDDVVGIVVEHINSVEAAALGAD